MTKTDDVERDDLAQCLRLLAIWLHNTAYPKQPTYAKVVREAADRLEAAEARADEPREGCMDTGWIVNPEQSKPCPGCPDCRGRVPATAMTKTDDVTESRKVLVAALSEAA